MFVLFPVFGDCNNAVKNAHNFFWEAYVYFELVIYVELLGCSPYVCLAFVDAAKQFSQSSLPPAA